MLLWDEDETVHILSYDENLEIQAIATTSEDLLADENHSSITEISYNTKAEQEILRNDFRFQYGTDDFCKSIFTIYCLISPLPSFTERIL